GDVYAMQRLGDFYYTGDGVKQDYSQAMLWYQQAAIFGDANAMMEITQLYAKGLGIEKNNDTAIRWWKRAAQDGSISAVRMLRDLDKQPANDVG
ncbi:MAG: tetratricopeptide repeat protein, partial [Abditibacteriaceae bacterium]